MRGAIPPLRQYVSMAWCLVEVMGQLYLLTLEYSFQIKHLVDFRPYYYDSSFSK
jgi:hypothetical protein